MIYYKYFGKGILFFKNSLFLEKKIRQNHVLKTSPNLAKYYLRATSKIAKKEEKEKKKKKRH